MITEPVLLRQLSVTMASGAARITAFTAPARAVVTIESAAASANLHGWTAADLRAFAAACHEAADVLDVVPMLHPKHIPAAPKCAAA